MKSRLSLLCIVLAAFLSGCKTYLEGRLPPSEGLTDKMRETCATKPRCYVTHKLKSVESDRGIFPTFLYARMGKDTLESKQKNILIDLMQESCAFADVIEGEKRVDDGPAMSMKISTWIDRPTGYANRYDFSFLFDVIDEGGVRHQYRIGESVLNDSFSGNAEPKLVDLFAVLHRKVVNNLLVKMYEDGFFSTASPQKPDAVRAAVLTDERKKNLESLLKSGVITEEEYKKELGKEAK